MIFQTILVVIPCQENRLFIQRTVADNATVPIYYDGRIAKLALNAAKLPKIGAEFEEIAAGAGSPSLPRITSSISNVIGIRRRKRRRRIASIASVRRATFLFTFRSCSTRSAHLTT